MLAIRLCSLIRTRPRLWVWACWILCSQQPLNTPDPVLLLDSAQTALDAAVYGRALALALAQDALALAPQSPALRIGALNLMGAALLESGDATGALQQYSLASQLAQEAGSVLADLAAEALNGQGECHYRRGEYRSAERLFGQALQIRRRLYGDAHPSVAASHNDLGNCAVSAGHYDQALALHRQALALRQKLLPPDHPDIAVSLGNTANCLMLLGDHANALELFQQALRIRVAALGPRHPKTATLYNNIGNCHAELRQPEAAWRAYATALDIRREALGDNHPAVATTLENMGDRYFDQGDCLAASDYFRRAWYVQAEAYGPESLPAATLRHKLGLCLQYKREFEPVLDVHLAAMYLLQAALGENHLYLGGLYNNIGNCYAGLGDYAQAEFFFKKARLAFEKNGATGRTRLPTLYANMGAAALEAGQYAGAFDFFQKALDLCAPDDVETRALQRKNCALALQKSGHTTKALAYLKRAIAESAACSIETRTEIRLSEGLIGFDIARHTADTALLLRAAPALDSALQWSELSLLQIAGGEAREFGARQQHPALSAAIQAYFALYERTQNADYLSRAVELSEINKSLQWAELARKERAGAHGALPDSLWRQERELSAQINQWEQRLIFERDPAAIASIQQTLSSLRRRLRDHVAQAGKTHPNYPPLYYDGARQSTAELQRKVLDADQAFIQFFDADSLWLVFVMTDSRIEGKRIAKPPDMLRRIGRFRRAIQDYAHAGGAVADSLGEIYVSEACAMHQLLVEPLLSGIAGERPRWVLALDGPVAYLPFECLIGKRPHTPTFFKSHDYLLRRKSLAYAHSLATLSLSTDARPGPGP